MGYDVAAIETMAEKRALLERACRENAWICLEHDPEIALARPAPDGDDFGWREKMPAGAAGALPSAHAPGAEGATMAAQGGSKAGRPAAAPARGAA
jgi:hypothetical protein